MAQRIARRILLLGWDGADWKLIKPLVDRGEMPHLERLINTGVMGNLATLRPVLSPMLWTSVATGMRADRHGIQGFIEPQPDGSGVRPVSSTSLQAQPLWNILEGAGLRSAVVSWFATHPADALAGTVVSNQFAQMRGQDFESSPLPSRCVSPESLRETVADLRVHPAELDAAQILYFIPEARRVDQSKDRRLASLMRLLANCASVHGVGTWLAERGGWDLLAVYYNLIDLAGHKFMRYRPPKMDEVSAADAELYGGVVDNCYRFHDLMLGRYLRLVGPDTTIVIISDHGFHSDHLRPPSGPTGMPGPEAWHRDYGILLASGPGIHRDRLVFGASLLDIAPTVLTLLGLPVARDMPGTALVRMLEQPFEPEFIETYGAPDPASAGIADEEDPWAAQRALKQLAALGYVEPSSGDAAKAIEQAESHRLRNLAEVHFSAGEQAKARALYEELLGRRPDDFGAKLRLAQCLVQLNELEPARVMVGEILAAYPEAPFAHMLEGILRFRQEDYDGALAAFQRAEQHGERMPRLYYRMGAVYLHREMWSEAERVLRRALELDEEHAPSYHSLGIALLKQQRSEEARDCFLRSIALMHFQPAAHLHLGQALAATGRLDDAVRAFKTALAQRPDFAPAHACLAQACQAAGDSVRATFHRSEALRLESEARVRARPTGGHEA